jgi:hypothetical protein
VVYGLVDAVMAVVSALMGISSLESVG